MRRRVNETTRVDPTGDIIYVNVNKPKGYICSFGEKETKYAISLFDEFMASWVLNKTARRVHGQLAWQRSGFGKRDIIALEMELTATSSSLKFETHQASESSIVDASAKVTTRGPDRKALDILVHGRKGKARKGPQCTNVTRRWVNSKVRFKFCVYIAGFKLYMVTGWNRWVEPAFLLWKPEDPDYERPVYDPEKAKFTAQEELDRMREQVNQSDGFDIDFDYYRCVFNYHRAYLDDVEFGEFGNEPETTGDFLTRLAQKSLKDHNVKEVKCTFKFVYLFILVIDPYDGKIKPFQARVRYLNDTFTEYIFCRPKPNIGVRYYGNAKTNVAAKKQRLESELLYATSM
ncbi:hypothetical protein F2Q69_00010169, partial [Brassica cretica]